jgi:hypothetical protein
MKRISAGLALVLAVSLLVTSDVQGGFGLAPAGKTAGPSLTATIVIDVTQGGVDKGQASIRVQKAGSSKAVLFDSGPADYLRLITWSGACTANGLDLQASTNAKFVGKMDGWVPATALTALLAQFGAPDKAAITDTDYAACTSVGGRNILSFTAVIQFEV